MMQPLSDPPLWLASTNELCGVRKSRFRRNLKVDGISASANADRRFVLGVHL